MSSYDAMRQMLSGYDLSDSNVLLLGARDRRADYFLLFCNTGRVFHSTRADQVSLPTAIEQIGGVSFILFCPSYLATAADFLQLYHWAPPGSTLIGVCRLHEARGAFVPFDPGFRELLAKHGRIEFLEETARPDYDDDGGDRVIVWLYKPIGPADSESIVPFDGDLPSGAGTIVLPNDLGRQECNNWSLAQKPYFP